MMPKKTRRSAYRQNDDRGATHLQAACAAIAVIRHSCASERILLAEHAASAVDRREIHFLRKVKAPLLIGHLARDEYDGRTIPM
jgi:hypothetical protein